MAIIDRTRPYELLVRYDPAGQTAAHVQTIREILDGETVISATLQPPQPIEVGGPEFAELVDLFGAEVQQQRAQALAELAAAQAGIVEAEGRLAMADAERDRQAARADAAEARLIEVEALTIDAPA